MQMQNDPDSALVHCLHKVSVRTEVQGAVCQCVYTDAYAYAGSSVICMKK